MPLLGGLCHAATLKKIDSIAADGATGDGWARPTDGESKKKASTTTSDGITDTGPGLRRRITVGASSWLANG